MATSSLCPDMHCLLECVCQTSCAPVPDATNSTHCRRELDQVNAERNSVEQFRTGQSGSQQATIAHNEVLL